MTASLHRLSPPGELGLRPGQVALHWLGQSGFALYAPEAILVVDAFLSPHPDRQVEPPLPAMEVTGLTAILCTHEHWDHLDIEAVRQMASASPEARVVVPAPIVPVVQEAGIERSRILGAQPGRPIELAGVTVHSVPAMHGIDVDDAYSFGREQSGGLTRYLGYVLDFTGVAVYHAGDTIRYPDMEVELAPFRIDVALLPINGRDAEREANNIVGNLDPVEAFELARAIRAETVVPMHYDMFAGNPGYPEEMVRAARQDGASPAVLIPARDIPFIYTAMPARRKE